MKIPWKILRDGRTPLLNSFNAAPPTVSKIIETIKKLKDNKTARADDVHSELLTAAPKTTAEIVYTFIM